MPEVSVVIPAYNAAATLQETLASVLAQTFTDFEAIVVDDGSRDDTATRARACGDPRVRVLSIANGGVAAARNRGIDAARAELIAFLDADDLWRPEKLALQVEALRAHPAAGICVTSATRIDSDSHPIGPTLFRDPDDVTEALLLESMIVGCISSGVIRRPLLERVGGFDTRFSQCADWDLWLRLSLTAGFVVLAKPLVHYRSYAGNMSSNLGLLERDTFAVLDKFFADTDAAAYRRLRRRVYSNHWMICGGSYAHGRYWTDAVRCLSRGLLVYPPNVRRPLGAPLRWLGRDQVRLRAAQ
jgi:glycosyltransferase involved in cell wall biosynthesis